MDFVSRVEGEVSHQKIYFHLSSKNMHKNLFYFVVLLHTICVFQTLKQWSCCWSHKSQRERKVGREWRWNGTRRMTSENFKSTCSIRGIWIVRQKMFIPPTPQFKLLKKITRKSDVFLRQLVKLFPASLTFFFLQILETRSCIESIWIPQKAAEW